MNRSISFYYGCSFSAFRAPSDRLYRRPPTYISTPSGPVLLTSAPFVLNYLNKKYKLRTLVLTPPPTMPAFLEAYRSYRKPAYHFVLPLSFSPRRSIALYYNLDRRVTFYKLFFFKRLFFCLFYYKFAPLHLPAVVTHVKENRVRN